MRAKSFGAERRQKQDQQGNLAIVLLALALVCSWFVPIAKPFCVGALQGAWSPLLVMTLRYAMRVVSGRRRDLLSLVHALMFITVTIYVACVYYPHDVWHFSVMFLCFVSTVLGVVRFRFTILFMFINCMIAGLILL